MDKVDDTKIRCRLVRHIHCRFDGEGLATAKLTRRFRQADVHMVVGPLSDDGSGPTFPVNCLIQGVHRLPLRFVVGALKKNYEQVDTIAHDGKNGSWLGTIQMPKDRLWSSALKWFAPYLDHVTDIRIAVKEGMVDMYSTAISTQECERLLPKLQGAIVPTEQEIIVKQVDGYPEGPWERLLVRA